MSEDWQSVIELRPSFFQCIVTFKGWRHLWEFCTKNNDIFWWINCHQKFQTLERLLEQTYRNDNILIVCWPTNPVIGFKSFLTCPSESIVGELIKELLNTVWKISFIFVTNLIKNNDMFLVCREQVWWYILLKKTPSLNGFSFRALLQSSFWMGIFKFLKHGQVLLNSFNRRKGYF
jgi:hypothetical protein